MKKYEPWLFKIPSLPKPWYEYMGEQCQEWALSRWHLVILGLAAWKHLQETDPAKAAELAEQAGKMEQKWSR